MNAPVRIDQIQIDWAGCDHWQTELPYRALVSVRQQSPNGTILYQVAGSNANPQGGEKALREAMKIHGGKCYYCEKVFGREETGWTLDHIEPQKLGGKSTLHNLAIACQPCNAAKGHQPIDSFNPTAAKKWLEALALQLEQRYSKLKAT
jgi:5-methylcytosine-specific restriction endonuclease McrA